MVSPVRYHLAGFPPVNIDWRKLVPLSGAATAALARYGMPPDTRVRIIGIEEHDGPGRT